MRRSTTRRIGAHRLAAGAAVGALAFGLGFVSGNSSSTSTVTTSPAPLLQPAQESRDRGGGCGVERADVKHLTDGFKPPATPTVLTPDQLVAIAPPPVTPDAPRILDPVKVPGAGALPAEGALVELRAVHVVAAKQEADSDLHVIIASPTGAELNVESPAARCDAGSPYAGELARARAALDAALPSLSSSGYTPENLTATIRGVLFFDVLHGQRGAPNGVELHPVTYFATSR